MHTKGFTMKIKLPAEIGKTQFIFFFEKMLKKKKQFCNFDRLYRHQFYFFYHKIEIWLREGIKECFCEILGHLEQKKF